MDPDVKQRVIKIICEVLNKQENEVSFDTSLRKDLQLDSLSQMTLFIALEDEFQQTISPEQVSELDTINEIVEFIRRKLQELSSK